MAFESWLKDLLGIRQITVNGGVPFPQSAWVDFVGSGVSGAYDGARECVVLTFAGSGGSNSFGLKEVCKCATTANVTLSGLQTIDGVAGGVDVRVLVKQQAVQADNGIYLMKETAWVRATDADASAELPAATIVPVDQGTVNADSLWRLTTNAPIVLGVSALVFARFDGADARALQGTAIDNTAPTVDQLLTFDGTEWMARLLVDASIDDAAGIQVHKLAAGAENEVIRTVGGLPEWGAMNAASIVENIITTPSIGSNQNNYSPAGWDTATVVRFDSTESSTPRYINGFGPATVKKKLLINPLGTRPFVLPNLAGGQAAGNQIRTPSGEEYVLAPGSSCQVFQDEATGVWWVVGPDQFAYNVLQQHIINVIDFTPQYTASSAELFKAALAQSRDSGGIALMTARGEDGARAMWNLGRWTGVLQTVYVTVGVGDYLDASVMGSAGSIGVHVVEPNVGGTDFLEGKKFAHATGSPQAVSTSPGEYNLVFGSLNITLDPTTGHSAILTAIAGAAPSSLHIHSISCYVQHARLVPFT